MIITKIIGGLGNQLFQYAAGRAIAHSKGLRLKLDLTGFDSYNLHHGYRLNEFSIDAEVASTKEIFSLKGPENILYSKLRKLGAFKPKTYYNEKQSSSFDEQVYQHRSIYLDGYWQNELYFRGIREILLNELVLQQTTSDVDSLYLKQIESCNSVSIHVRRGDYLLHRGIGVLGIDRYKKAISMIKDRVDTPHFFIFSDDMHWCKDNFKFLDNCTFVEHTQTEVSDLKLMSACQHNIIANSSFSWWAAWLNVSPNRTIIAPAGWRLDDPGSENIILSNWLKF